MMYMLIFISIVFFILGIILLFHNDYYGSIIAGSISEIIWLFIAVSQHIWLIATLISINLAFDLFLLRYMSQKNKLKD